MTVYILLAILYLLFSGMLLASLHNRGGSHPMDPMLALLWPVWVVMWLGTVLYALWKELIRRC